MKKQAIIFTLALIAVIATLSAVSAANNVYVDPNGNDSHVGTQNDPYQTISWGISNVDENGNVNLAPGTYSHYYEKDVDHRDYGININKNVTIIGSGQSNTIIDAQNKTLAFYINTDKTLTIKNLTIINGTGVTTGGAVENHGTFNAYYTTFDHNQAKIIDNNGSAGGAIWNTGYLLIEHATFTNNFAEAGGAIYNNGSLSLNDSTFSHNTGGSAGGAIFNSGTINLAKVIFNNNYANHDSAAIRNEGGNIIISDSTFTDNNGELYGAIDCYNATITVKDSKFINNSNWGISLYNSRAKITGNQFLNNREGIFCPTIDNIQINYNRFVGNTFNGVRADNQPNNPNKVDATLNWWRSNAGPNTPNSDKTYGNVNYTPWLTMKLSYPQKTIYSGSVTRFIADFLTDSIGGYHSPSLGHIPDGTPVIFKSQLGQVGSYEETQYTVNGSAQDDYRAVGTSGAPVDGNDIVSATGDNEVISNSLTIQPTQTPGTLNNTSTSTVNAASQTENTGKTIGMQNTGLPIAGLILAVLMLIGGLATTKR